MLVFIFLLAVMEKDVQNVKLPIYKKEKLFISLSCSIFAMEK